MFTACENSAKQNTNNNSSAEKSENVKVASVGDVMVHKDQLISQSKEDGSYDFNNNFRHLKDFIINSDLSIANLETTINPSKSVSAYPSFNSPPEILDSLKNTGFDVISTINNHSLDSGVEGVYSTIKSLQNVGLKHIGTQLSESERNYITENVKDIKIGISSFSYAEYKGNSTFLNGIPSGSAKNNLNTINVHSVEESFNTIKQEIDKMKADGCEFIILNIHWGDEYKQTPNNYQKELSKKLINEGVDVIFGSHPHVVQPIEVIQADNSEHKGVVFYSMGNIISNQQEEEMGFSMSENGIIPIIEIKKDENKNVELKSIEYIPTWVHRKALDNNKYEYTVIPLNKDLEAISNEINVNTIKLQESLKNTVEAISNPEIQIHKKQAVDR